MCIFLSVGEVDDELRTHAGDVSKPGEDSSFRASRSAFFTSSSAPSDILAAEGRFSGIRSRGPSLGSSAARRFSNILLASSVDSCSSASLFASASSESRSSALALPRKEAGTRVHFTSQKLAKTARSGHTAEFEEPFKRQREIIVFAATFIIYKLL